MGGAFNTAFNTIFECAPKIIQHELEKSHVYETKKQLIQLDLTHQRTIAIFYPLERQLIK